MGFTYYLVRYKEKEREKEKKKHMVNASKETVSTSPLDC